MKDLVMVVEDIRADLHVQGRDINISNLRDIIGGRLDSFVEIPQVKLFIEYLEGKGKFSPLILDSASSSESGIIIGIFNIPYNRGAFFEAISYHVVTPPKKVLDIHSSSHAVPITVDHCTGGFNDPLSVALFPENFYGARVEDYHKAFYFVDRFAKRCREVTLPAVRKWFHSSVFPNLLSADDRSLKDAASAWVHLHEYHHRTGSLPLPKHLPEKSALSSAGLEELRVDLLSYIDLCRSNTSDVGLHLYAEFILAERLIRYPIMADPEINYDARGSIALQKFLSRRGLLRKDGNLFRFIGPRNDLIEALLDLCVEIRDAERRIATAELRTRRRELSRFLDGIADSSSGWARAEYSIP